MTARKSGIGIPARSSYARGKREAFVWGLAVSLASGEKVRVWTPRTPENQSLITRAVQTFHAATDVDASVEWLDTGCVITPDGWEPSTSTQDESEQEKG